jgi:lysophospholipid acyltransferase (LPLAT)-like uncharacterized protein
MTHKKIKQNFLRFIGNFLISALAGIYCDTLKIRKINSGGIEAMLAKNENFVLAFWHGSMLIPWYVHREQNLVALVSKSKDGGLLARLLEKWKYDVVRGSSNDGGGEALKLLLVNARNKRTICITPDGPKGPLHVFKAGAIICAMRTGIPVFLCAVNNQKKRVLGSWDKFEIPKLFSTVDFIYSDPVYVAKNLGREEISKVILDCENKMNQLLEKAKSQV